MLSPMARALLWVVLCLLALRSAAEAPASNGPKNERQAAAVLDHSLQTPHFIILHTAQGANAARFLVSAVEDARADTVKAMGTDFDGITEVRLAANAEEYDGLSRAFGAAPRWAVALASPVDNVILLDARSLVADPRQPTLKHELVHIALGRLGSHWPHWFHEGLAQSLTDEHRFELGPASTLRTAMSTNALFRFDDLENGFPAAASEAQVAYAQSAAFVDWLVERHGRAAFGDLYRQVIAGDTFPVAFAKAFRSTVSVEEARFRSELPSRYPWWLMLTLSSPVWSLLAVAVVIGHFRKRRRVARFRAQQREMEAMEDYAAELLARAQPANDNDAQVSSDSAVSQGSAAPRIWNLSVHRSRGG
jgi:hypothetical protein